MKDSKNANSALVSMLVQIDETLKQVIIGTGAVSYIANAVKELSKSTENDIKSNYEIALKLTKESKKRFEELKSQIINTATEITENYKKELTDTETELTNKMSKEYVAISDFGVYKSDIATQFSQTSESIKLGADNTESIQSELSEYKKTQAADLEVLKDSIITQVSETFASKEEIAEIEEAVSSKVTQSATDITDTFEMKLKVVSDELTATTNNSSEFIKEINAYIKRGELETGVYGIEIGRSDSNMKARFTNDKLSFYQGSVEVAYISGNNLYISRAEVLDYLRIGNSTDGYFIWDVTSNGLELRWDG